MKHDLVLFGATGFTGALTAEYLARHAPQDCSWALAGRSLAKLEAVRDRLAELNPACAKLPLLTADVSDPASLRTLAEATRVVITTVGPYILHGEPLVAACAAAGTDYVDLTGEPEFVDLMYVRHHPTAVASGARIVHCCGFDSIPYDLGIQFTVDQLPEDVPLQVKGLVRAGGRPSGGTYQSALLAFSRARSMLRVAAERRRIEPKPVGRQVHQPTGTPGYDRRAGSWVVPLPTIDPQVVVRSAAKLERYGPDFTYRHYAAIKQFPVVAGAVVGAGALLAAAQLPPARDFLLTRLKSGDGPSAEQRAKSWFNIRFVGEGGGRRVVSEVAGGDPGYDETAKMLSESALSLAFDDLPTTAGQVTTAVAMGSALRKRLVEAGITFRVVRTTNEP